MMSSSPTEVWVSEIRCWVFFFRSTFFRPVSFAFGEDVTGSREADVEFRYEITSVTQFDGFTKPTAAFSEALIGFSNGPKDYFLSCLLIYKLHKFLTLYISNRQYQSMINKASSWLQSQPTVSFESTMRRTCLTLANGTWCWSTRSRTT